MRTGGGPKERIDRRSVPVLVRPIHNTDCPSLHEQVAPGWGDVDPPVPQRRPVGRVFGRELSVAREDQRKNARRVLGRVEREPYGSGQLGRQPGDEVEQRFDPAGRRTNDDYRAAWHATTYREKPATRTEMHGPSRRRRAAVLSRRRQAVSPRARPDHPTVS
jgi:hypothetical protein